MNLGLIKRPILTEKAHMQRAQQKYIFEVDPKAHKTEIKALFEAIFGVKVAKINIHNKEGKKRRVGKYIGRRNHMRYAIVTLKPGQKLAVFDENVPTEIPENTKNQNILTEEQTRQQENLVIPHENVKPDQHQNVTSVMKRTQKKGG